MLQPTAYPTELKIPDIRAGVTYDYRGHKLRGWFTPSQGEYYRQLVGPIRDGLIVEVGVYGGVGLLHIAELCRNQNNRIVGIDCWDDLVSTTGIDAHSKKLDLKFWQAVARDARDNLEEILAVYDLGQTVTLRQAMSLKAVEDFPDRSVDLVFIDAEHTYASVLADIQAWYPKVKTGGVLAGHDADMASVMQAVTQFAGEGHLPVRVVDCIWSLIKQG